MATKMKAKDKKNLIIASSVIVSLIVVLALVAVFSRRGERVPSNPEGTIGNLAGNLNNGGIVCESNGKIYFSNPYDGGALYVMNTAETECKKLSTAVATSINVTGDYIYYFQSGSSGAAGLGGVRIPLSYIRMHVDGKRGYTMTRSVVVRAQVIGDWVYMEGTADKEHNAPYLIRMDTNAETTEPVANFALNPSCAVGDIIYYNNVLENHNLMALDTKTGRSSLVLEGNIWNPIYDSGYIYYMAPADGYQLRRYSLSNGTIEILTDEKVESYNVYRGFIYYQTFGDSAYIAFMNTDGSGKTILANGNFNSISMTNGYVYFKDYWNETSLYHTLPGSSYYEPVNAAVEAAVAEIEKENK